MKKKIAYLGAGTWGFALAALLGNKGHEVTVWTRDKEFAKNLQEGRSHPKLLNSQAPDSVQFTSDLKETLEGKEVVIESVTAAGIRPVFEQIYREGFKNREMPRGRPEFESGKAGAEAAKLRQFSDAGGSQILWLPDAGRTDFRTPSGINSLEIPVILTSKGIEQGSGLLLPEVISEWIDPSHIGILSGPSLADEVIRDLPTSVVCSAYDPTLMKFIHQLFTTPTFRIYPNEDTAGVAFGGAMKNIIAIACGISDGLGNGDNAKAALMTRGLHEIRKLAFAKKCNPETLNGLSGMGDLSVTCMSTSSRNYRFGKLLAEGFSPEGARQKIGMAVEGVYTCVAARELGKKYQIPVPITEVTYAIIYEGLDPREAVRSLLQRTVKEEHL